MHPLFALALLDAPGEPHSWFQEKHSKETPAPRTGGLRLQEL